MTEPKKNKINDFLNSLQGKIIGAVTGLIVVFLVAQWEAVVSTFDTGKAIEKQTEFEYNLKEALKKEEIVSEFMENEKFVSIFFKSETVKKHIEELGEQLETEIHDKIVVDVTKSDSNKVSMRSFVGTGAGIRDEMVLPIITEMVKEYNENNFAKKKDVRVMIKQNVKTDALKPVVF